MDSVMNVHAHVLGEFVARLAERPNVEMLSDDEVGVLLNEACKKYRFRPSLNLAKRLCLKASEEIWRRKARILRKDLA
jgi:hypothetical protein